MKALFALAILFSASQAHALYLKNGETAMINGNTVTCGLPTEKDGVKRCVLKTHKDCVSTAMKIYLDGEPIGSCLYLQDAVKEVEKLRAAGLCN